MSIKIEVGQWWRQRNGLLVEIKNIVDEVGYPVRAAAVSREAELYTYTDGGYFLADDRPTDYDLVELVKDVEAKPKGTLEEIHELEQRLAKLHAQVSTSITLPCQITPEDRIELSILRDGALSIDCWENDSICAIELAAKHGRDLYKILGQWYD
jgi:hypothetical protein